VPKKTQDKSKKPKPQLKKVIDQRLIKALAHPLRAHIFAALNEREASPSGIGREIDRDPSKLNYHFEELEKCECIELARTERRRGAIEHFYRAKAKFFFDDREWERLPMTLKLDLSMTFVQAIVDDVVRATKAGTFDARDDRHVSWTPVLVDEKGMGDLSAALMEALKRVFAIQAESAERMAASGEKAIPVTVAMLGFETPSGAPPRETAAATG